jgi:hypothetical protein
MPKNLRIGQVPPERKLYTSSLFPKAVVQQGRCDLDRLLGQAASSFFVLDTHDIHENALRRIFTQCDINHCNANFFQRLQNSCYPKCHPAQHLDCRRMLHYSYRYLMVRILERQDVENRLIFLSIRHLPYLKLLSKSTIDSYTE